MPSPLSTPSGPSLLPRLATNFWFLQFFGWGAMISATLPFKLYFLNYDWKLVLLFTALRDTPGFFWTLWMRHIYRKRLPWLEGRAVAWIVLAPALSLLGAIIDFVYIWEVSERFGEGKLGDSDYLVMTFVYRWFLFLTWSILYFGIKAMIDRQRQAEALRDAEMQMLRAQINPHFFFNALNTIQAGVGQDPKALTALVQSLAGYLRYVLKHRQSLWVPLGEEYNAAIDYLAVEKARFCEGIELECSIEPGVRKRLVPSVLIQPLLENAVKYGRKTSFAPLQVILKVAEEENEIVITVANSGEWVPESKAGAGRVNGIGLENLQRRLGLSYPGGKRLSVGCETAGWVRVQLRLPVI